MQLDEVSFVVTDTETTGTKAADHRLIEIAAVKVQGGGVVAHFTSLINPGRSVPGRITRITGISTAMVFDQPAAADVLPQYLDFLGDGVLVAHNLPFDLGFVNAELARLDRPALPNATLCTLRLARRLLPGLRSKGLTSVAEFYGVPLKNRHRALGDAETTAEVLLHFLKRLKGEYEMETLEDLLAFQYRIYSKPKQAPKYLQRIREEVLSDLPARPGVYFMKDGQGAMLYIGKAKSLRARVRSYFNAVEAHPPRIRKLVEAVRDVSWTETGSELGALLLESRLIKEHQPRFNRALRRYRSRPFIRLDTSEAFPRVSAASYLMDDGAEYFGPVGGRRTAELVIAFIDRFFKLRECDDDTFARGSRCLYASLDRCDGPCEDEAVAAQYAAEVERVRAFLTGRDRTPLGQLEAEMQAAAARLEFEQAAQFRDWYQKLERLLNKQQRVAAPVLEHNGVLVLPGVAEGTAQLLLVRFGRHIGTVDLSLPPQPDALDGLRRTLDTQFDPAQERPARYLKQEVDEVRVLAHWMYVNRATTRQVPWQPDRTLDAFLAAILQELNAFVLP